MTIVSDELQHTKPSVHAFMTYIFSSLKAKYPDIQRIDIFSDGAASQFKQRFLFSNLYPWEEKFEVKLRWHFFATSHGKGVVDGLGGTIKRSVFRYIRTGKAQAATPEEFAKVAATRNPGIHIKFITSDEVNENKDTNGLDEYWKGTLSVYQTHKIHHVVAVGPYSLLTADTSDAIAMAEVRIRDAESEEGSDDDGAGETDEDAEEGTGEGNQAGDEMVKSEAVTQKM